MNYFFCFKRLIRDVWLRKNPTVESFGESWQLPEDNCQTTSCKSCRYYYGETDRGQLLVCAVRPYGVETDWCSDWEAK